MALKKKTIKKVVKKSKNTRSKPKKTIRRKTKKTLVIAPSEKCFWVWNGPVLSNLWELQQALEKDISDIQFEYHCTNGKCDFALWVNDVLCDKACARALARAKTHKSVIAVVKKCLREYK